MMSEQAQINKRPIKKRVLYTLFAVLIAIVMLIIKGLTAVACSTVVFLLEVK